MCGLPNDKCTFDGKALRTWLENEDVFTHVFVPFTVYPWPDGVHPLEVHCPWGHYASIACADGEPWSFDEGREPAMEDQLFWPWMYQVCPGQLGDCVSKNGDELKAQPAVLLTELADEGNGPFAVRCHFELDGWNEDFGALADRQWWRFDSFIGA